MKKSLTRVIASLTVCAAGLAGALVTPTTAEASQAASRAARSDRPVKTNLGYKATVYGTKVIVDGVEMRNSKEAFAQQACTRYAGRELLKSSTLSLPDNELIKLSAATSHTQTYLEKGVNGVRGVSTIADLQLGGELQGIQTPTLSLKGLTSVADAYRKADGTFGHRESFTFEGLRIENLPAQIPQELQDLLDILGSATGDVVTQVIDLLTSVTGNTIEIPGLGSIGLGGVKSGTAKQHSATSETYALRLLVNATGHDTVLTLGRARTALYEPVPAGVFHSRAMGVEMFGGNDLLRIGGLQEQALSCSGTNGKTRTHNAGDFRLLGGLVNLTGVQYKLMGDQDRDGSARGFIGSNIGSLEIPSLGLVIDEITSKVAMRKPADTTKVRRTISTRLARIVLNGEELPLPKPGEIVDLGDNNILQYRVVKQNWTGAEVKALRLTLPGLIPGGSIIEVGWAGGHINPN
ncbi:choice-of-anchor P family protein [Nocardioides sp.]|uniref:choice-of-anchor P family protein n=1 Tax=Nocardioides sp. TaxID=35761 RepID=UPI002ED8000D